MLDKREDTIWLRVLIGAGGTAAGSAVGRYAMLKLHLPVGYAMLVSGLIIVLVVIPVLRFARTAGFAEPAPIGQAIRNGIIFGTAVMLATYGAMTMRSDLLVPLGVICVSAFAILYVLYARSR